MTNGTANGTDRALKREAFPGAWLASKLGVEPTRLESRRRSGELLAVRNGRDYLYPTWQFAADGNPFPWVGPVVTAAAAAGLDGRALYELLQRPDGMTSGRRLVDGLRNGGADRVIALIRSGHSNESNPAANR